jgi:hypothetical protein
MSNEADSISMDVTEPMQLLEAQTRVAQLQAKLAEADQLILNALDSSVGFEDMCTKLRRAHATLKRALADQSRLKQSA